MSIGVIGMTVTGLVYAAVLAKAGYQVLVTDMDEELVTAVKEGDLPGYERGLQEAVADAAESGNLVFTGNMRQVVRDATVFFITCEAPEDEDGRPGIRFAEAILSHLANHAEEAKTIVLALPLMPGASEALAESVRKILEERQAGFAFDLLVMPVLATQGRLFKETLSPKTVIIGTDDPQSAEKIKTIYRKLHIQENKFEVVSPVEAEMAALGIAGMQAVKRAYINEFAHVCDKAGADPDRLVKLIGRCTKTGASGGLADAGFGGSHLPRAIRTLMAQASDSDLNMPVLKASEKSNQWHQAYSVSAIEARLGELDQKVIGIFGIVPEAGSDDLREAPALYLIEKLAEKGAQLKIFSPEGYGQARWRFFKVKDSVTFCNSALEAAEGADAVVTLSRLQTGRSLNKKKLKEKMAGRIIFDFAGIFTRNKETETLFDYYRQ